MSRERTFSSSNIHKLMTLDRSGKSWGAPALKYIKQVAYEKELERPIKCEQDSRPTSWGKLVEPRAFELLPLDYQLVSTDRIFHPDLPWSGAPDIVKPMTAADIKCPYSPEVFCDKIRALTKGLAEYKEQFPEDYWQHISNCILLDLNGLEVDTFEAIIYMPYKSELEAIRTMIEGDPRGYWINYAEQDELPWIQDGGKYKNLNVFAFPVPVEDKILLTETVKKAVKKMDEILKPVLA